MTYERETVVTTRPVERETVVTRDGGSGGLIAGILGAIVLILIVFWALTGGLNFGNAGAGGTVDVDVPAVTVTPDGQ